ncbi:MAG TPA: 16S rRNA (guanine(966)-N(2))-methyltransferase RsmD [Candidatus Methylomirabilis sp.]|jgi:16S rRNA (guanine(966)-N(2))-methyltransferase RsmD
MRIIAGERRGQALRSPRRAGVRPTGAYLREAVFNVLAARIPEAHVLDLYAGTGAMGLEALSRGAAAVTFVDRDVSAVRANLARLAFGGRATVMRGDAARILARLGAGRRRFDVIYADPPYAGDLAGRTVAAVAAAGVLAPGGVFLLEHHHKVPVPEVAGAVGRLRVLRHGETMVSIYVQRQGEAGA